MKSLNQKLIALAAAVVFTTSSLSAVNFNVGAQQAAATEIHGIKVTNLPVVNVQPDRAALGGQGPSGHVASLRSTSLMSTIGVAAFAALPMSGPVGGRSGEATGAPRPSLLGSQLAMPYYSFGNKFGRISKE